MKTLFSSCSISIPVLFLFLAGCTPSQVRSPSQVSIDGKIITEQEARKEGAKELEDLELKMLQAKAEYVRDEHKILGEAFDRIVNKRLLEMEAAKRSVSTEELIQSEIREKLQSPSGAEVESFYEANKFRISVSREEALPKIRELLENRQEEELKKAFYENLEKEHEIVRSLEPVRFDVDAVGSPSRGPQNAPVVLVEFSDFQCSYCRAYSKTLEQVMEKYGDKVRLVYRQFPLASIHPDATRAAEASLCAADQNRFWEMHDIFFEGSGGLQEEDILKDAEQLDLDIPTFKACLSSGRHAELVEEDLRAGAGAGVGGTPALFVNGRYLDGNRPYDQVAAIIEEELVSAGNPR